MGAGARLKASRSNVRHSGGLNRSTDHLAGHASAQTGLRHSRAPPAGSLIHALDRREDFCFIPCARHCGALRRRCSCHRRWSLLVSVTSIMSTRLDVKKTYKLYIGGKFPRSESGRCLPAQSAHGEHLDNFAHASRKDFRDAVVAARAAADGWAGPRLTIAGRIFIALPRCCKTAPANWSRKSPAPPAPAARQGQARGHPDHRPAGAFRGLDGQISAGVWQRESRGLAAF